MLFIFIFFIIMNLFAFFMPKNMSRIEIYATSFFALNFGIVTDMVLDLHYDLYGYIDKGFQWLSLLGLFLMYPAINTLFLNFFPFNKGFSKKLYYILGWSLFSVTFEWIASRTAFFYHDEWKLWHSTIAYPFIFIILAGNLKLVKKFLQQHTAKV